MSLDENLPRGATKADALLITGLDILSMACAVGAVVAAVTARNDRAAQWLAIAALGLQVPSQSRVNKILGRRTEPGWNRP